MTQEINNGKDIYDYTLKLLQQKSQMQDKLSQRLLTIIGFNALFIKFSLDLSSQYPSYALTKIIAILLFVKTIIVCLCGLKSQDSGDIYSGINLKENLWSDSVDVFYITVIEKLEEATKEINDTIKDKQKFIDKSLICAFLGICSFAINIILTITIPYL